MAQKPSRQEPLWLNRITVALGSLALTLLPLSAARAQTAGDIVIIGNTPGQQAVLQDYWHQLRGLSRSPLSSATDPADPNEVSPPTPDPQQVEQALLRRVRVSTPELRPIIGLSGSSQIRGTVTNGNDQPITVTAVNYEIIDNQGNLVQTGSATPEPATIAPGQTVTFTEDLLATSVFGKQVRLAQPAVVLQREN